MFPVYLLASVSGDRCLDSLLRGDFGRIHPGTQGEGGKSQQGLPGEQVHLLWQEPQPPASYDRCRALRALRQLLPIFSTREGILLTGNPGALL